MENNNQRNNEEIDLNDLFIVFKKIGNAIGDFFVQIAAFFLKFALIIGVLIIAGIILGYFWNENSPEYVQTQSILGSDYEASPYLYKKINEINYKFSNDDEAYQQKLGLESLKPLELEIEPILFLDELSRENEIFLEFIDESASINDELKEKLWNNSLNTHKITLKHPLKTDTKKVYELIYSELKNNQYFKDLYAQQNKFLSQQIKSNEFFIQSLDSLMQNYGKNPESSTVVVNGANFDFNGLLYQRTELQKKTSQLITQLNKNQDFIFVIDQGTAQKLKGDFLLKLNKIIVTPILLVFLFIVMIILLRVLKKARRLNQ